MFEVMAIIAITDGTEEGIEEVLQHWTLATVETIEEGIAIIREDMAKERTAEVEDLGQGYYKREGEQPTPNGLMDMWLIEEVAQNAS